MFLYEETAIKAKIWILRNCEFLDLVSFENVENFLLLRVN